MHWNDGGPTDLANLRLLCRHHHQRHHCHDDHALAARARFCPGRRGGGSLGAHVA
ncbi:MAG: hypothetical protein U5R31_12280 [Acidimicrobiia bacterium]|nr:hypothetical protein [Acidimicrobiia bacterium]